MEFKYFVLFVCVGAVYAQDSAFTLPPGLAEKIGGEQLEEIFNKSEQQFKEMCEKNGASEPYPKAKEAIIEFQTCLTSLVSGSNLQEEIEKAKPNGQVDEVFKKYCDKTPDFKLCFANLTDTLSPCVSAQQQASLKIAYNVTEQLAEFICYKDGDRIALFIAEGGPECFEEKKTDINDCVNKTFGVSVDANNITADANLSSFDGMASFLDVNKTLDKLKFGEAECKQLSELQLCVVKKLETCSSTTSANIVEALFKFVRKVTPCNNFPAYEEIVAKKINNEPQQASSGAALLTFKSIATSLLLVSLLL